MSHHPDLLLYLCKLTHHLVIRHIGIIKNIIINLIILDFNNLLCYRLFETGGYIETQQNNSVVGSSPDEGYAELHLVTPTKTPRKNPCPEICK